MSSIREHSHLKLLQHHSTLGNFITRQSWRVIVLWTFWLLLLLGLSASSVRHIRPCKAVLPSGQLLVVGGGSSGESWRMDPHGAWLTPHWHNTKAATEARTSAPAVCCLPAPTADVQHESQLCSACRGADQQTAWRHVHADEDPKLSESLFRDKPRLLWLFFCSPLRDVLDKVCAKTEANLCFRRSWGSHVTVWGRIAVIWSLTKSYLSKHMTSTDWAKSQNKFPDIMEEIILFRPRG